MKSGRLHPGSTVSTRRSAASEPQSEAGKPLEIPKYRQVYEDLLSSIKSGTFRPGDRLPSEAELGKRYDTSRITVAKAVNELHLRGLVSRRAGSGTHVLAPARTTGHLFGLLIPDLGRTEIFEPICHGMMQSPLSKAHSLLWGHAMGDAALQEREAEQLCRQYIEQKVSGVFFAPLEFTPAKDAVNHRIVSALEKAGVAVVLLDRCYAPYPLRSKYDLVGIDNRRAGFLITQHLLRLGLRRIAFVAKPLSASTVVARIAGYREALFAYGIDMREDLVRRGDPDDPAFVEQVLQTCKPEAIVCANDAAAARLMTHLNAQGIRVPEDMRIVGIDDVKYAAMLPTPLTTQHQNCANIGAAALSAMLERLENPQLPTRDILLQTHTVVRRSCGAHLHAGKTLS
ncbi:GntR family transcriptional regulator [Granulicella arctica]|uniref:DNA-binding LacI/PurR family transcriptional regulator n=1 Tax=Granulicella arctica TaxID=940613 RepID=A0A7Y9PEP6_9BACT|nr:substrate-binding domain-containing protein [Granulicella arctica]NYF78314.1 DNA-binding LacI/PurR family transcriptional regulator [Granulicella arctica]